jgi:hypothetical protein
VDGLHDLSGVKVSGAVDSRNRIVTCTGRVVGGKGGVTGGLPSGGVVAAGPDQGGVTRRSGVARSSNDGVEDLDNFRGGNVVTLGFGRTVADGGSRNAGGGIAVTGSDGRGAGGGIAVTGSNNCKGHSRFALDGVAGIEDGRIVALPEVTVGAIGSSSVNLDGSIDNGVGCSELGSIGDADGIIGGGDGFNAGLSRGGTILSGVLDSVDSRSLLVERSSVNDLGLLAFRDGVYIMGDLIGTAVVFVLTTGKVSVGDSSRSSITGSVDSSVGVIHGVAGGGSVVGGQAGVSGRSQTDGSRRTQADRGGVVARDFADDLLVSGEVLLRDLLIGRTSVGNTLLRVSLGSGDGFLIDGNSGVTASVVLPLCEVLVVVGGTGGSLLDLNRSINNCVGSGDLSGVGDRDGGIDRGNSVDNNGVMDGIVILSILDLVGLAGGIRALVGDDLTLINVKCW